MRVVRRMLKLVLPLAVVVAVVYVVFVIGDAYRFDSLRRGNFQTGPRVSGSGDARKLVVGLSVQNRGDRNIEIRKVGGVKSQVLSRVKVRMDTTDREAPATRLRSFEPFELPAGRQREIRFVARFKCSEIDRDETILIRSFDVRYKVGLFDKRKDVALIEPVSVGRRRAHC